MKYFIYLILVLVLAFSIGVIFLPEIYWLEHAEKPLIVTALLSLLGIVFHFINQENIKKHEIEIERKKSLFAFGAMSHMANVVFDKHVEFCEQYLSGVEEAISNLYSHGPTNNLRDVANKLYDIRNKFAAWIPESMSNHLEAFETALLSMSSGHFFVESTTGNPVYIGQRGEKIDEMFDTFTQLLGLGNEEPQQKDSVKAIKKIIREILDIDNLLLFRKTLLIQIGDMDPDKRFGNAQK